MKTRVLGRTGVSVSTISFGTEYLINKPQEHVDQVLHAAIERGINLFDVFYGQGYVREIYGKAFKGYRDRVMLTAHLGAVERGRDSGISREPQEARHFFEEYLRHFMTDYVDILYLHNVDTQEDYDKVMGPGGLADLAQELRSHGKARFIGLSGHTVSTARQAVESGLVDVLMFPVNIASNAIEGKRDLLEACAVNNVAVIAMKPFAGGKLLQPETQKSLMGFQTGGADTEVQTDLPITAVKCLDYVLSRAGVATVVPGFATVAEMDEGLGWYDASDDERDFSALLSSFAVYQTGECVYCNHCLPCPVGITVGNVNRLGDLAAHNLTDALREAYAALDLNASDCIQCGTCEDACPFGVAVIDKMEQTAALYA
ncbi:MAG: aldo/keto reductase [Anaerolineae bacterium]|nr:4Fe-4S binding protein [Chloroflexota bacterium]